MLVNRNFTACQARLRRVRWPQMPGSTLQNWLGRFRVKILRQEASGATRCRRPTVLDGLPASAQGPINGDEARRDVPAGNRQLVLLGHKLRLRGEDTVEIDNSSLVLGLHQHHGILGLLHGDLQALRLELVLEERHQGVFDLLASLQDSLLILKNLLLEAGILLPDIVEDAAIVQDPPGERRQNQAGKTLLGKQAADIAGGVAEETRHPDLRVEVGFRHADPGTLGRRVAQCPAHVGPALEQLGGNALELSA